MTVPTQPTAPKAAAVQMSLDAPPKVARWRVIGNPIMAIPHLVVLYVLGIAASVTTFIAWFAILFTGRYPAGLWDFAAGVHRYQWRVGSFYLFMREPYPAFGLPGGADDPGGDPASLTFVRPERLSRLLLFVKWLLVVPVYLYIFVLAIALYVVLIVAFFAVLFTGRWPEGMRTFTVGVMRLGYRAAAYQYLMTDVYPGFSLQP